MSHDDPKPTPSATPSATPVRRVEAPEPVRARLTFQTEPGAPLRPTMRRLLQGLVHYEDRAADDQDALAHDGAHSAVQAGAAQLHALAQVDTEPALALPDAWETVREPLGDLRQHTQEMATVVAAPRPEERYADTATTSSAPATIPNRPTPSSVRVATLKDFTTASMTPGAPGVAASHALPKGSTLVLPMPADAAQRDPRPNQLADQLAALHSDARPDLHSDSRPTESSASSRREPPPSAESLALRAKADAIMQGEAITAKPPQVAFQAASHVAAVKPSPAAPSAQVNGATDRAIPAEQPAAPAGRRLIFGLASMMLVALIVVLLLPTRYFGFGMAESITAAPSATLELNGNMRVVPSAPSVPPKVAYVPPVAATATPISVATGSMNAPSAVASVPEVPPALASSAYKSPVAPAVTTKPTAPTSASIYAPSGFVHQ